MVDIARHGAVDAQLGPVAEPGVRLPRQGCPPADDYSEQVVLLGRLKAGTTFESRRVVHAFPLVPDLKHSLLVTARCGETLPSCDLQWLPGLTGMPCEECVMPNQGFKESRW